MFEPVALRVPALTCPHCGVTVKCNSEQKLNECCVKRAKEMLLFLVVAVKRDARNATPAARQDVKSLRSFLKSAGIGLNDYEPSAQRILKGVLNERTD